MDIDEHTSTLIRALNNTYFCTKLTDNHQPIFTSYSTMSVFWRNHVMSHVGWDLPSVCFWCQTTCCVADSLLITACEAKLENQCATDPHFTVSVSNFHDALSIPSGGTRRAAISSCGGQQCIQLLVWSQPYFRCTCSTFVSETCRGAICSKMANDVWFSNTSPMIKT